MEIPIELFISFLGISGLLIVIGFLRNPQIPATVTFGGLFILVLGVTTTNIILSYSDVMNNPDTTIYEVLSNTANLNVNTATYIRAEYPATSSSILLGKSFDCIEIPIAISGSPPINTPVIVGIYDNSGTLVKEFGRLNITSITTGFFFYDFCLSEGDYYTFGTLSLGNERVGIMYNDGDATHRVLVRADSGNPFDSTNTVLTTFSGSWSDSSTIDLSMTLYLRGSDNGSSANEFEFTELPKVLFSLIGGIFMLLGALMVSKN